MRVFAAGGRSGRAGGRVRRVAAAALAACWACPTVPLAAPPASTPAAPPGKGVHVDAENRRLDVDVEGRDLVEVLGEIARPLGIDLVVHGSDHGTVTARLHDVTLEEGISRLLEGRSFAVSGLRGEGPARVWLLSGRPASGATTVVARPARNGPVARARSRSGAPARAAAAIAPLPDIAQWREMLQQVDAANFEEALSSLAESTGVSGEALEALREELGQAMAGRAAGNAAPVTPPRRGVFGRRKN